MTTTIRVTALALAGLVAASATGVASAQGSSSNWNITGFVRQELAFSLGGNENPFNQWGNPFNGRLPPTHAAAEGFQFPAALQAPQTFANFGPVQLNEADRSIPFSTPATPTLPGTMRRAFSDDFIGNALPAISNAPPITGVPEHFDDEPQWNLFATRLQIDVQYAFSSRVKAYLQLRAFASGLDTFGSAFDKSDFFEGGFFDRRANLTEVNAEQVMLDFPSAYLDYSKGPWWFRVGNQQIAWGEAIFFRVLDVVNGLDLRRHSVLDVAAEEFSDKRTPAPAVRMSYSFNNGWEFDGFVQMATPTVLSNVNTPYNAIASQFIPVYDDAQEEIEGEVNFGGRLIMRGLFNPDLTVKLQGVSRINPDGWFKWKEAPRDDPRSLCLSTFGLDTALGIPNSCTAFASGGTGVHSPNEWDTFAALSRLDAVGGLTAHFNDFEATQIINAAFGLPPPIDLPTQRANLGAFFSLGPLNGYIEPEYDREMIFGAGFNYIVTAEPGSWLDQLVVRGEVAYTPDKEFTPITLSQTPITKDEVVTAVILEKYHRFSDAFPATFMVLQWMWRKESDLFGRHLSGMDQRGIAELDRQPDGDDHANYFTFAMQQPFPNLIWRGDLAVLVDPQGGYLIQPGLRFKPSSQWQFDFYANIIGADDNNDTPMQTLDEADELFARVSFFF